MKKVIFTILFLLLIVFFLLGINKNQEIRIRIISNSDSLTDVAYKNEVVKYFKEEMLPKLKLEEVYLKDNVSYIEEKLNECFCDIKVEFIWYTFTNKEYNGNAIENGRYKTLLITIGKGLGSNWWGSVFDESLKYESTEVISYKWYFEKYINGWN